MSRAAARLVLLSRHRSSSTKLPHNPYYALPSLFHNEKPSRFSTPHHNLSRSLFTFSFSSPFKPNSTMNPHNFYFSQTPTIVNPINIIMRSYSAKAANPGSKDEKKGPKHASKKKKNNPKKSSSLAIGNRRTRFLKHRRGEIKGMKGTACQGNRVSFGSYALQALEPAWITSKQIEAGRKSMTRYAHRGGKIWIRVIPDKSVTGKPVEVRMGRGKGAVKYMAAVVKPGRVLYEISGVPENIAKEAITLAGSKMPIRTKFIRA